MTQSSVVIYHNPRCSNSRGALELVCAAGVTPEIIEYLRTPPSRETLQALLAQMGLSARALLREKEDIYAALDLGNPKWSDVELIEQMLAHPILINRPIVVTQRGTRLCRPPETVLEIL